MTAAQQTGRTWRFPAKLTIDQSAFAILLWAGFLLVMVGVAASIAYWSEVDTSIMEGAATQIPRWFVLFIGVYLAQSIMPMYIAHGRTRRDFAIEVALFTLVYASVGAVLVVIGFALEAALYNVMGWPHVFSGDQLFTSPWQIHAIFFQLFVSLAVWTLGGLFIGAAFVASDDAGFLSIPAALIPAGLVDVAIGSRWGPVALIPDRIIDRGDLSLAITSALFCASVAIVGGMAWLVIRNVPMRSKSQ